MHRKTKAPLFSPCRDSKLPEADLLFSVDHTTKCMPGKKSKELKIKANLHR